MNKIKPQIERVYENEVLLREGDRWLYFTEPHRLISVTQLEGVLHALHEVERLVEANHWYAAGFLSYEAAPAFDPAFLTHSSTLHPEASLAEQTVDFPYLWFGLYPEPRSVSLPTPAKPIERLDWLPTIDKDAYHAAIERIRYHIAEGRTYQVNYTMRLTSRFTLDAWDFFLQLARSQNNHAAYIHTAPHVICSASPELFFQLDGNHITCRPMKGTAHRGLTNAEDRQQADWLKQSEKNRAENVMIVDMIRNDLGRIAETGSVSVPSLFETERYPTLWQMTSTVQAKTNVSLAEIFRALFPCASITGAPKVSTMNIIAELENTPRRIYTGSIGHFFPERKAKFNVAIRTALIDLEAHSAEYGVGGGIVWDSNSTDEYAEALLKARVLTEAPQPFSLLETLLWTPQAGFFLLEKHIQRMFDSAKYFDIPISKEKLRGYLGINASAFCVPQRVRVLLHQDGDLISEFSPFDPTGEAQPLKVRLATEPIDSRNVFLFHKTTRREVYESAYRGLEEFDDVLLYNERGEITEFTLGNLVAEMEGRWITPPTSSGLLAGTFRAHLMETSRIVERTIRLEDLEKCTSLFRVNSVRQWQRVKLLK